MDERERPSLMILVSGAIFLLVFVGLGAVALATAELNVATLILFGISLFVVVAVVGALIGAMKRPPEEEVRGHSRRRDQDERR
jgi:hypothetical protein